MSETILCVDDDPLVRRLIERLLEPEGYTCACAATVEEARALLATCSFPLVLCDIELGDASGLELLDELAGLAPETVTIMVTGRDEPELADTTLAWGAYGYVTKPFSRNSLLIDVANALHRRRLEIERRDYQALLEETVAQRTAELRGAYEEMLLRLGRAVESRDGDTGAHIERVGTYAQTIALALGLEPARARLIGLAAPLHDLGKIAVRDRLLYKPGVFTAVERLEMQRHAEAGHRVLAGSGNPVLELAATIAWTHHERWDGTGYPRGLAGEEIPLEGRIVAVADVFDALTTDRPYRDALSLEQARDWIVERAGADFDPAVAAAFLAAVDSAALAAA
ncbi:MAG TPA: HD domain-containing phosphohydrolase [Gaiellaceae bacterium]|nr:HD domain-containing phosphohydrolase [Gaiellaceae bacterium]